MNSKGLKRLRRTSLLRLKTSQTPGFLSQCQNVILLVCRHLPDRIKLKTSTCSKAESQPSLQPSARLLLGLRTSVPARKGRVPESLDSACCPEFGGTCSISINRENFDAGWQIPLGLFRTRLSSKTFLMKDLDDGLWSLDNQTVSGIPTQRDHITTRGCRPALGQIKDQVRSVSDMLKVGVSTHFSPFHMSHLPWLPPTFHLCKANNLSTTSGSSRSLSVKRLSEERSCPTPTTVIEFQLKNRQNVNI